jgi:hypothetical protein
MYSLPVDTNPFFDTTGEFADLGQSGPVWFLAGSINETLARTVTVPHGKFLFFPVMQAVWINVESLGDDPWSPEQREVALDGLGSLMDDAEGLVCEIDGVAVSDIDSYRTYTAEGDEYLVAFPDNNLWGIDAGVYGPTVDMGMYLMLRPLAAGHHTIHVAGSIPDADYTTDVTYEITVEAGDGSHSGPGR